MEKRPELTMMEDETGDCEKSTETLIATVLSDIRQKGFSFIQFTTLAPASETRNNIFHPCATDSPENSYLCIGKYVGHRMQWTFESNIQFGSVCS